MAKMDAAQIAQFMSLELEKPPYLTDAALFSGDALQFVSARLSQIAQLQKKFKLRQLPYYYDTWNPLFCDHKLYAQLQHLNNVLGFKIAPTLHVPSKAYNHATFKVQGVSFETESKKPVYFGSITGIAYDRPVTRSIFETRWTLQVLDNLPPDDAVRLSERV